MTEEQLTHGIKLKEERRKWERLNTHFKDLEERKEDNYIKEINNLLTGYNNLMGDFNRKELALLMLDHLKDYGVKKEVELSKKLDEL
jgi:hypothetical protein